MQRFLALILSVALFASAAAAFDPCHDSAASGGTLESRYSKGLLFKIEKCGQPISYLFGTLHMDDPDVDKAASQAFALIPKLQAAGFEITADKDTLGKKAAQYMFVGPDSPQRLSKLIGIVYFARLIRMLGTDKASLPALERSEPWAVAMILEVKDIVTQGLVLDEKLQQTARQDHKEVFGLETPDEQFNVFAKSPMNYQIIMLKDTMDEMDDAKKLREEMLAAYIAHDGRKLVALDKQMMGLSAHPKVDAYYMKRLLEDRNAVMEARMKPHLAKASNLIALGMLHLLGKGGIIDLLEHDGYYVSAVP